MKLVRLGIKFCCVAILVLVSTAVDVAGMGSIEGAVVDLYVQAVSDATIELKDLSLPHAGLRTTSDSNGNYIIRGLEPGEYELAVTSPGFRREVVSVDLRQDELKHIIVGLEVGRLADAEPISISGDVRAEGKLLSNVIVTVTNVFNNRISTTATSDVQGRYKLKIFDGGQYMITAFRPGFEASVITKRFDGYPINRPRNYNLNLSLIRFRGL